MQYFYTQLQGVKFVVTWDKQTYSDQNTNSRIFLCFTWLEIFRYYRQAFHAEKFVTPRIAVFTEIANRWAY